MKRILPVTVPGAVIFSVDWGLYPGGTVASLGIGNGPMLIGLAGMFLGAHLQGLLSERLARQAARPQNDMA